MREDIFNFKITKDLETVGKFDMPKITAFSPGDLQCEFLLTTPFNYALTEFEPGSKICHFYLDDYQFERVWREPSAYIPILRKFNAVIGSDFSMYSNLPKPQQIYNNWRNKVLMAYWQANGVKVIPNIQWSGQDSFEYCFDGIEPGGVVAICTTGCHTKQAKEGFMLGFNKMLEVVNPQKILCVGKLHEELENNEKIIKIDSFMETRRKLWVEEEANLKPNQNTN